MTASASDTAFLAEVEDFLTSCDLPVFPWIQALHGNDDSTTPPTQSDKMFAEFLGQMDGAALRTLSIDFEQQKTEIEAKRALDKERDRKRRAMYRANRRMERDKLRQEVGDLTTELSTQQKARDVGRLPSSTWKMVAERQLKARLSSEAQQRRLAAAVAARSALLQQFRGMVFDHPPRSYVYDKQVEVFDQNKRIQAQPTNADIFAVFLLELETTYTQVDEVFCSSTETGERTREWNEDGETGYFQRVDEQVLPYDVQQTHQTIWQAAHYLHRQEDREHFSGIEDPDTTTALKFRLTTRLKSGSSVSALQRVLVRRYKEHERMVIVWRASMDGEGKFAGMHADETGWNVCTPATDTSDPTTLARTCVRNVPMYFKGVDEFYHTTKQFTGMILESGEENCAAVTRALEKLQTD